MASQPEIKTAGTFGLALDMVDHALEALAMLYELRHPGEYASQAFKLKEYVADNFRHIESSLPERGISVEEFRGAVMRVRELFDKVDSQVGEIRKIEEEKAA